MYEQIVQRLCDHSHEVFIVGGAVRDMFLGLDPTDIDLATSARPEEIAACFPELDARQVGKNFGVVFIHGIEVATYRSDTYFGGGRNDCKVSLVNSIEEDLGRRDFTINAMALCPINGEVIDPYNGQHDLQERIVRFVGNPVDRIKEDPSRMIRAVYMAAKINGFIHPDTIKAIREYADRLELVPAELQRKIIMKALATDRPSLFFKYLQFMGLLERIFPHLAACHGYPGGQHHYETVFQHCMYVGDHLSVKYPLLRLAGYLHDVGKPATDKDGHFLGHEDVGARLAEEMLTKLRFSFHETTYICNLIRTHMRHVHYPTARARRRLLATLHENHVSFKDWLRLRLADRAGNLAKEDGTFVELLQTVRTYKELDQTPLSPDRIALNGREIMDLLSLNPGTQVGKLKRALFEHILEHGEELNHKGYLMMVLPYVKEELHNSLRSGHLYLRPVGS